MQRPAFTSQFRRNQEHDEELVFHRTYRLDARKDLPGHHSRQRNKTDCRHSVNGRHEVPLRNASRIITPG
jgi:hypothetical protein